MNLMSLSGSMVHRGEGDDSEVLAAAARLLSRIPTIYAYVILDHAVAFGRWEQGTIMIGLDRALHQLENLLHVQELRLFHELGEFKATRVDERFRWRYRLDEAAEKPIDVLDETHKLWGISRSGTDPNGWTWLQSGRGTSIYLPYGQTGCVEYGVAVRHYIQFHRQHPALEPGEEANSLYRFVDERMVALVDWQDYLKKQGGAQA
ncbi:type III-D CRISPR-associated protein Csx19 [Cohnella fermenti]|uniref:Uncharacterized protein n=1 Tax=Cohnella fermenti TaxID=2565925 RepID=A0A4S4CF90_9BACL|nr:CRISPR-associated protein Csx19 [Cohnella fermenti]THF84695.1 hypothetical protein E6C55_01620 [Cohnella fermenti]